MIILTRYITRGGDVDIMVDDIDYILQNREKFVVIYDQPVEGIDCNGDNVTVNQQVRMTIDDCIKFHRLNLLNRVGKIIADEKSVLEDFLAIYYRHVECEELIRGSSNGRTSDFGSDYGGSNPSPRSN